MDANRVSAQPYSAGYIFANRVAVVNKPEDADFIGFKYMTHFQRKWLTEPNLSDAERANVTANNFRRRDIERFPKLCELLRRSRGGVAAWKTCSRARESAGALPT